MRLRLAFVLGDKAKVSTAVDNTIIERVHGIDVIGDSPSCAATRYCVRTPTRARGGFPAPNGPKVQSQPFLDNNNFGNSPVSSKSRRAFGAAQLMR